MYGNGSGRISLWLKLGWLAFVAVLVPVYWIRHGPLNFLWLSDIALLGGLLAAWLESRRLASMMLVAVLLLELGWMFDYLVGLLLGAPPLGLVDYMFDTGVPLWLRNLSLYHLVLPFALGRLVWRLGYDPQAFRYWLPLGGLVLLLSWWWSGPEANVNLMHGPGGVFSGWLAEPLQPPAVALFCALMWWLNHRLLLVLERLRR